MNENSDTHDSFSASISTRTAKTALSPRTVPIPIVSGNTPTKSKESMSEKEQMELSECYTCVISHVGNKSIRKHECFERPDGMVGTYWGNSWGFYVSPPKYVEGAVAVLVADFLNSCYLCRKKLQGLDIFMYRGDKAFCSADCRSQQILIDEYKEKCGSESLKSLDYSCSPCSNPRIISAGVAAA